MKKFALAALAALSIASPAMAQWQSTHLPNSPFTSYTGPNGWTGQSTQLPGSPFTNQTFTNPNGQSLNCTTTQLPGSPFASTSCN